MSLNRRHHLEQRLEMIASPLLLAGEFSCIWQGAAGLRVDEGFLQMLLLIGALGVLGAHRGLLVVSAFISQDRRASCRGRCAYGRVGCRRCAMPLLPDS